MGLVSGRNDGMKGMVAPFQVFHIPLNGLREAQRTSVVIADTEKAIFSDACHTYFSLEGVWN